MVDDVLGARLLALADPLDDSDWSEVLARSGKQRRATSRFVLVAAAIALVLLVVGASLAAVGGLPWWEGAAPPVNPKTVDWQLAAPSDSFPPPADRSKARTVALTEGAALVAAPVGDDGYCLVPSMPGSADLGVSCMYQLTDLVRAYARPATQGAPAWIIYGRVTELHAASLDLSEAAGEQFVVPLQSGGFFIATIPQRLWQNLGGAAGGGQIVDSSGHAIQRGCVNWGPSPAAPHAGESGSVVWQAGGGQCRPTPTWSGPPRVDLAQATKLVTYTLASDFSVWERGRIVAVWRAPANRGLICTFVAPVPLPAARQDGSMPGGGSCGRDTSPPAGLIRLSWSSGRAGGLITGDVSPLDGVVRVELTAGPRVTQLALAHNAFIGSFPPNETHALLPPGGPYLVIGYDAAGRAVARAYLQDAAGGNIDSASGVPGG